MRPTHTIMVTVVRLLLLALVLLLPGGLLLLPVLAVYQLKHMKKPELAAVDESHRRGLGPDVTRNH